LCDQIKEDDIGGACNTHGKNEKYINILVGKPDGKRPLGRPKRRWEDNIWVDLGEMSWEGMEWIHMAQDRDQLRAIVNTVMNLRVI
jgi:hypothetical protein